MAKRLDLQNKISFSFGKPSQKEYMAFYTDTIEKAKEKLTEYTNTNI